jgi:hypothetical protein
MLKSEYGVVFVERRLSFGADAQRCGWLGFKLCKQYV